MSSTEAPRAYFAHATAVIEDDAVIGAGTKIWHHAHIRTGAIIGSECILGKGVFVDSGALIGDRTKVQNGVSVYSGVRLGHEVFVGPGAVFTNDLRPRAANTSWNLVQTFVDSGASIGANATVICGNRIGHDAMIAAGAVITRDVSPHELVAGNPARHLGWVCWCGEVISRDTIAPTIFSCPDHREHPAMDHGGK